MKNNKGFAVPALIVWGLATWLTMTAAAALHKNSPKGSQNRMAKELKIAPVDKLSQETLYAR